MKFPKFKLSDKAKLRLKHNATETGIIAAGSLAGSAAYDGAKDIYAKTRKKTTQSPREFDWKSKAGWAGTIAAGDIIGEGTLDAIKNRRKKKGIVRGVEKKTAVPGSGPTSMAARIPLITFFIKKPDPYIIRRATLRGKKQPGVPKIKRFEDERKVTNLNPKAKKSETFKNVAVGTGALAGGAGAAYAGHKIGKAADIAEKLQKHVGGLATHAHDKIAAHVDYIGHHAGEAAKEASRTARATRKTATAYHPRAIGKMMKAGLKKVPVLKRFLNSATSPTNFNAMKEKHPEGEENKDSFLKRNGAKIVGTAAGIGGAALFYKHFKPPISGPDVTKGAGITKAAFKGKPVVKKPVEKKVRRKPVEPPITNIRRVGKSKKKFSARSIVTHFDKQGRDDSGRMAPKAELIPSYHKAKKIVAVGRRGGDVAQDLHDIAKGKAKDPKKKRFYEKAWFQGGALALAGGLAIRKHRQHAEAHGYHPYFSRRIPLINFAFLIHDDAFPIVPQKQPKLPKGMKQRVPVAETRAEVIARLKKLTELSSGGGAGKVVAETIIDGATIGADIGPKKKKSKAKKAADMADPDLTPTNNWTADMDGHIPLIYFATRRTEFTLLSGKKGNYRRPRIIPVDYPAGQAAYQYPAGVRINDKRIKNDPSKSGGLGTGNDRRVGRILTSNAPDKENTIFKNHGYASARDQRKAALRHELIHSIQASKDGYKAPRKVRQVVGKEVGAYANMDRGVKGGNMIKRIKRTISALPDSITRAVKANPFLKKKYNLSARIPLIEFYGTSAGVTASWDTRGRTKDRAANGSHWWTHSPTRNSVRVVRSPSEQGPRTRRGKKFHEKTSTHKAAIAVASGAAAGLGALALHKHLKLRKLDKAVHIPGQVVAVYNPKGKQASYRPMGKIPAKTSSAVPTKQQAPVKKSRSRKFKGKEGMQHPKPHTLKGSQVEFNRNG